MDNEEKQTDIGFAATENNPVGVDPSVAIPEIHCLMNDKNTKFIHRFHNLIADSKFIELCQRFEKNNIFNIVGRTQQENWHSSFIAWLLNPKGAHGLGYFPLRCLLTSINVLANKQEGFSKDAASLLPDNVLIDTGEFSDTVVRPESIGGSEEGEKSVRYVYGKEYNQWISFDIAISTLITAMDKSQHRLVLICENKVKSGEGVAVDKKTPQTTMYADYWCESPKNKNKCNAFYPIDIEVPSRSAKGYPYLFDKRAGQGLSREGHLALLFLSAKNVPAKDNRFINMDYSTLYEYVLLPVLNHPNISRDAKIYLQEYIDALEMRGYIESKYSEQLLTDIFKDSEHKYDSIFYQFLSYRLFSSLFSECPDVEKEWKKYWADHKKDIIGWLIYFSDINQFSVWQSKNTDFRPTDYNFIKKQFNSKKKLMDCPIYPQYEITKKECAEKYSERFIKTVINLINSIYENNSHVFQYINAIEKKYGETCDYLMEKFIKHIKRNGNPCLKTERRSDTFVQRDLPISNFIDILKESNDSIDYSYLKCKLEREQNEQFPVLYFRADSKLDYPIYINIDTTPRFIEKKEYDELSNQSDSESQQDLIKENWMSGNAICKKIADKLLDDDKKKGNYTWSQHLMIYDSRSGKMKAIPPQPKEVD